jgi:hypothetical protein
MNTKTGTHLVRLASSLLSAQTAVSFAASPPNPLTDDERTAGWKLLFDGKTTLTASNPAQQDSRAALEGSNVT